MQLPQVAINWGTLQRFPGGVAGGPASYGFGLFVEEDPDFGRIVQHSGGYPGFGSNMRWHPATGTGVIALGNSTYAAMSPLTARLLDTLLRQRQTRRSAEQSAGPGTAGARSWAEAPEAPAGPWPETLAARDDVNRLLQSGDLKTADRLFSENVPQDAPFAERERDIALVRERIGDFRADTQRPPEFDSPAQCRWWLRGERGVVQARIQLTPERPPRVQSLTLAVPPAVGSPLLEFLDSLVGWMNDDAAGWPSAVPVADSVDTGRLERRLRMAAVWSGRCGLGAYRAGDGTASATVELDGASARVILAIAIDPDKRLLRQADVMLEP
jgi:hypothetical protein